MNESEQIQKSYSDPPSYEEAVYGHQPERAQIVHPPVIDIPIHLLPESPPSVLEATNIFLSQNNIPQQSPHDQPYNTRIYNICPPGTEVLRDLNEILVYPTQGWSQMMKIRDHNKVTILHVKNIGDDCCDCSCDSTSRYQLCSLEEQVVAQATCFLDNINCCSENEEHLEVMGSPDVPMGQVWVENSRYSKVVNQSEDLLFSITHKESWWNNHPYEIFSANGTKIGEVDNNRGIKNRLTLPKELPVQHKILLLFFTIYRQKKDDEERRRRRN